MAEPNNTLSDLEIESKLKITTPRSAVSRPPGLTKSCNMFKKREGTSGISGHLFETKLLSLLYFRAFHDERITEFQLASNVDNMGDFDDICFKVKVEEFDRPISIFIQAKHRENKKQTLTIDLATYFISYLKVREHFDPGNKELFFKGTFDEEDCLFVLYTTARDEFSNDTKVESSSLSILNDLIGTGGTAKQPFKLYEDVEFLCKTAMNEQMISLAEQLAKFINDDGNFKVMLTDELIQRYHVVLAQKAVDVSEIQPGGHRIASFRQDFFDVNEEYLTVFKDTLIKQILRKRKLKTNDVKTLLSEFLTKPTDASILSQLIGTVIPYNNGQIVLDEKITKGFKPDIMKSIDVSRSTVYKAVEMAAKEILLSPDFKLRVPAAFGNKDITLSGSEERKKKRIKYLASTITDLLDKCKDSKMVTIDETLGDGFLQLNGGIAGGIGNLFVLDDNTKLMKITNNGDSLGSLAKSLLERLTDEIGLINENRSINEILNLSEYRFYFKFHKFPILLLECSEYEGKARDFLNKLVIYSNQADEEGVEDILKSEIEENQLSQPNYLQVQTDAILSKYHDKMLKWWKQPNQAEILTRKSDLFQRAQKHIIKHPLLIILTAMYKNKTKSVDYTFTEDAVSSLNLQNQHLNNVVITENSSLTVVKVMQHFYDKDHVVLDLEYVIKLPPTDRYTLRRELRDVNEGKVLIIVCDEIQKDKLIILEKMLKAVLDKKTVVVTNHASVKILQKYFPSVPVHDEKNNLINMNEESQDRILENARVMFQDTEVRLDLLIDEESKTYVKEDVLIKIINEQTIAVGKLIVNRNYDEIKQLHVDRRVRRECDNVEIDVETFDSIPDYIVLVTAEPGMGKSTLLTHLSIKTKERKPEVWIVRINLLEYSAELSKWKQENTVIDTLETLKFMCQVILRDKLGKENNVEFTLEEKNNVVYLKHCTGDPVIQFELNLFLHFYCKKEIILLFDAFDEICPHYEDVVMKCLKSVANGHRWWCRRIWITSRSYNEIKNILQKQFGISYEILYFTEEEMVKYCEKLWEINLGLGELNSAQLENIQKFREYMTAMDNKQIPLSKPLLAVFQIAACYLNCMNTSNKNYENYSTSEVIHGVNPLLLYLTALYVVDNIKNVGKNSKEWYVDVDTFNVYEKFLEIKIKRRYQEKNGMNIHNPDIIMAFDKELTDSILKHKKLGAYAILNEYKSTLFSVKELKELKKMVKNLEKGEEKTGLIDSVANGIPIFIHVTFTEYFAVEYVCDCLKIRSGRKKLDYFYMVVTNTSLMNVCRIFDHKIKIDNTLMSVLESHKDDILQWIIGYGGYVTYNSPRFPALVGLLTEDVNNLNSFFDKVINYGKNETNLIDLEDDVLSNLISIRELTKVQYPNNFDRHQ